MNIEQHNTHEAITGTVERQLAGARERLLDLTMRNRLLNYRPSKTKTLRIVDEICREIFDILVIRERPMRFLPTEASEDVDSQDSDADGDGFGLTAEEQAQLWTLPTGQETVADRHVDEFLQTALEPEALQKRLFRINQQAASVLEEQGYTVLFLALGFLEWKEAEQAEQYRKAPLIMVPVELHRGGVGKEFRLKWTGEDVFSNISLQAKLKEQAVDLPEFEVPGEGINKELIDDYFGRVQRSVGKHPHWKVLADINLEFFSFTKFVMFKDLDPDAWPEGLSPSEHELIKALLDPSEGESSGEGFSERDVDRLLRAGDNYHVVDADPSQIAVIEDIKAGRNLVVEGPPGTGKSQTITNIIAELLAEGKSVLFVSEKMAALEVVKERLDSVGLGEFCLEVHSRHTNKRKFLAQLETAVDAHPTSAPDIQQKLLELETLKTELNDYAAALRTMIRETGLSTADAFGMREEADRHFRTLAKQAPFAEITNAAHIGTDDWALLKSRFVELAEALRPVHPVNTSSWTGCEPGLILPADEAKIRLLLRGAREDLSTIHKLVDTIAGLCGATKPSSIADLDSMVEAARVVAEAVKAVRDVLLNSSWNQPSEEALRLIQLLEDTQSVERDVRPLFKDSAFDVNATSVRDELQALARRWYRFVLPAYWKVRKGAAVIFRKKERLSNEALIHHLDDLARYQDGVRRLNESKMEATLLFGSHWQGLRGDPNLLRTFAAWIVRFRQQLVAEALGSEALDVVVRGPARAEIESAADTLDEASNRLSERLEAIDAILHMDHTKSFGAPLRAADLLSIDSQLAKWVDAVPNLYKWAQYVAARSCCRTTPAQAVVDVVEQHGLEADDIMPALRLNFADAVLQIAFTVHPVLARFVGETHEERIKRFASLDREIIGLNRKRLRSKLSSRRPTLSGGASAMSEAGILLGQFNRKRGHMAIRRLMSSAGGLIQRIKPCFMMSPLSVAQYLDPRTAKFDVVVFDEASQVRPEEALGALLRADQGVVIGDTKQLPPTSFFDHIEAEEDYEDDQVSVADVESILHQCRRSFGTKRLRWHYRSKHESLIAVANHEFYDNDLLIYPSPIDEHESIGLHLHHAPDTVYQRGRSSGNRMEARLVAGAALDHYRRYPGASLGVGTFNIKQQQLVLEEIELQLHRHPEMEQHFAAGNEEHFFVKNLENIQGDERDVIFISVGFGFDNNRRLHMNFGPLNKEGGERRLNVIITRARERCVVFANFTAADLAIRENSPRGVRALKTFLQYAETRDLTTFEPPREDVDSPFEESVDEVLSSHGYDVRRQVGCAGFRVDLAVVHPQRMGEYLIGIECDGAKYHSSPVARERDRLRQQILESRGWKIHRVWSTDWYRNRRDTEQRLLRVVEEVASGGVGFSIGFPKSTEKMTGAAPAPVRVEESADVTSALDLNTGISQYLRCTSLGVSILGELHLQLTEDIAVMVKSVVDVESPVHGDEIIRRIRTLWGLGRTGKRIEEAVRQGIERAVDNDTVVRSGSFYWHPEMQTAVLRRRSEDPAPKMDIICDEEIERAVIWVLEKQFATPKTDLALQAPRALGFQRTTDNTLQRVASVIGSMESSRRLIRQSNGMLDVAK